MEGVPLARDCGSSMSLSFTPPVTLRAAPDSEMTEPGAQRGPAFCDQPAGQSQEVGGDL